MNSRMYVYCSTLIIEMLLGWLSGIWTTKRREYYELSYTLDHTFESKRLAELWSSYETTVVLLTLLIGVVTILIYFIIENRIEDKYVKSNHNSYY